MWESAAFLVLAAILMGCAKSFRYWLAGSSPPTAIRDSITQPISLYNLLSGKEDRAEAAVIVELSKSLDHLNKDNNMLRSQLNALQDSTPKHSPTPNSQMHTNDLDTNGVIVAKSFLHDMEFEIVDDDVMAPTQMLATPQTMLPTAPDDVIAPIQMIATPQ